MKHFPKICVYTIRACMYKRETGQQRVEDVKRTREEAQCDSEVYVVWIGEEERIASFHAVNDYEKQTFSSRDNLIDYLRSLQERGFRFQ